MPPLLQARVYVDIVMGVGSVGLLYGRHAYRLVAVCRRRRCDIYEVQCVQLPQCDILLP